ncbi:hypothetical protein VTI74DRAFT_3433 [Chaetomium olivicolor]
MHLVSHAAVWFLVGTLACLGAVNAAGMLEIDVVFPRSNETYAPTEYFPIVFALQNAKLARHLEPIIYSFVRNGSDLETFGDGRHDLTYANYSSEPYFVYHHENITTEGPYELFTTAVWQSCNKSGDQVSILGNDINFSIHFTIKRGGQEVDLVAATANDKTCSAENGVAINVTDETYEVPPPPYWDPYRPDGAVAFIPLVGTAVQTVDFCPERYAVSGPSTGNWSIYPNFKIIKRCQQTMFYDFSLYDPVDDPDINHRIQACSSFGPDFDNMLLGSMAAKIVESANSIDVEFELGWWHEGFGLAKAAIQSLVEQIREYIDYGHGASDRPFILYALRTFQDNFDTLDVTTPSLAMQLCGQNYDSTHVFGVVANATCLLFLRSKNFPGKATFTTPLLNGTLTNSILTNSTVRARHNTYTRSLNMHAKAFDRRAKFLQARANCRTVQVASGDGCAELAVKCGSSGADFTKYNPGICSSLKLKQYVCCSSGSLPDFRPKPNADGSCFSYKVQTGDNCANLGAEYGLTIEEIEGFNKNTWGWSGCKLLFAETIMCLSTGKPPFPTPIANAVCGPQKLGSKPPTDGSNIADLNPCPLNACCNIWGQCGISKDFCIDTNTGPPGTAAPGTYGCISNCGLDVIKGTRTGAIKIAYFQGYGMNRKCLYQDALQIDTSKYTHVHFGFATLTPSYEVQVGDTLSSYIFGEFKRIRNAKRILSFGGWDFSTSGSTYYIFREDLPDFDPGKAEDGPNYLAFLAVLKNLLRGKTVAIAAPASYWYLKQFPIKDISRIVDYIVYMTQALAMITKAGVPGNKIVVGVTSYGRSFAME